MQEFGVVSYTLLMSLIEYKTLILREETEAAEQLLPTIPKVCCCACCAANCIFYVQEMHCQCLKLC